MFSRLSSRVRTFAFLLVCVPAMLSVAAEEAVAEVSPEVAKGRDITSLFYKGELKEIHEKFSSEMSAAMSIEDLRSFLKTVTDQLGVEKDVLEETIREKDGYHIYTRRVRFTKVDVEALVMWAFKDDGTIGGFFIKPNTAG